MEGRGRRRGMSRRTAEIEEGWPVERDGLLMGGSGSRVVWGGGRGKSGESCAGVEGGQMGEGQNGRDGTWTYTC